MKSPARQIRPLRWLLSGMLGLGLFVFGQIAWAQNAEISREVESLADSVATIRLPNLLVYASKRPPRILSEEEKEAYRRRIRDVRRTLPYAKYVARTIIETYEYAETLESEKERAAHWRKVEKELKKEMDPKMRKLTLRQGKLLIKLINRQTGQTSYQLTKTFLGSWKAFWWNGFAKLLGANLNSTYDPENNPDDRVTEYIVQSIEAGIL